MSSWPSEPKKKFKIAHSLEQLEDELVLTLKDKPILKDNKEIDQDEDLFENEEVQALNKMKHNAQLRKKIKELSDVSTSHLETKYEGKGGILPHYDDHSFRTGEIEVEQNGSIKTKRPKTVFKNTQSDFLTVQDTNKATKLGSQYSNIKIKRALNKKGTPSSASGNTSALLDFLNETAQDNSIQDKQFKRDASQAIENALDSIRKKRILEYNAKKQVQSVDISSVLGTSEEQELLNKAMQKARRNNLNKKNILEMIKQEQDNNSEHQLGDTQAKNNRQKTVQIQLNPISYRGDDKKYVRKDFDIGGMKSGTTSAMFVKLPSERLTVKKQQDQKMPESFKDITPEELEKMKQEVSFLEDKALGTGLAGTLQYLRENSLIGQQEQVGRSTDKSGLNINDPNDRIKLQYRNANGKLMKPKQAFRYLCATFHGEGPSKNKIEKRKKKQLQQMRMKERSNTGGQFMNLLNEYQRKNNEAHMVIDFGKKAANNNN